MSLDVRFPPGVLVINLSPYSWDDPGSDLNKFPIKPSKTIDSPGKLEGNIVHRMYYEFSPKIVLWVTEMIIFLQSRKEWGSRISINLLRP
jgi:hypothetical protein